MTPEQIEEIARLRSLNLSSKQIARQLGLRPAEVSTVIREQAEEVTLARIERGELAPIESCLINESAAKHLLESAEENALRLAYGGDNGLAQIFVTRVERNRYLLGSYLVDYWCLGVKDTFGPRKLDRTKYEITVEAAYLAFDENYREITLKQAQAIIFGAVDYAAKLGFNPHPDFESVKAHLGQPLDDLPALEFGREGKPFYMNGPYDRPSEILATLQETVGEGNFDYVLEVG